MPQIEYYHKLKRDWKYKMLQLKETIKRNK